MLVRSAHSANIKERRDCSTALFDAAGEMVMQAEHIPVHLGAMPAAVAAVRDRDHAEGVSWVLNDPYAGGTHLPDITVVTPAFHDGELLGFAAARAHHADVGGRVPGSMPSDSTTLEEEGVVIAPRVLDDAAIDELADADAPARAPARRPARPARRQPRRRAAAAASWPIASAWTSCARRPPPSSTTPSGARARAWRTLDDGTRTAVDLLEAAEGDLELRVAATVDGDELTLDFSGSAAQHEGNLNCPLAVTRERVPVRGPRAHRPRHPAQRGRLPADHRRSRPRARCSTRARPRRSPAATSRPPRAWPTSCSAPSAAPWARAP